LRRPNSRCREEIIRVLARSPRYRKPRRPTKFTETTKTLVAALVLAGASIAFVADASAAPRQGPSQAEQNWMNRASAPDTERNAFGY
jgi:hypothetical protein